VIAGEGDLVVTELSAGDLQVFAGTP